MNGTVVVRNTIIFTIVVSVAVYFLSSGETAGTRALKPGSGDLVVAFVDVHVVPMDRDRILERQTVIVRDRRIEEMGPSDRTSVPDGAVQIDGRGKYLLPGLAEMHGHLPQQSSQLPDRWHNDVLFLYVANGVTTIRGMQGRNPHLGLRDNIENGDPLGPRFYVASPPLNGQSVKTAESAESLVRQYKQAGYDLLKIHEGLSVEIYNAVAATAREVGIPFAGHVPNAVGLYRVLDAGQITIDHMDNMVDAMDGDEGRIPELVSAMREVEAWVVPTEVLWEVFLLTPNPEDLRNERKELMYVPPGLLQFWVRNQNSRLRSNDDPEEGRGHVNLRRKLLKALSDGGVGILLGTDSPQLFSVPGFSIHREMQVMVECGLTPYEVLESGTRRVAEYFGTLETTGTVAAGKRADLILLNANPLEDVANISRRSGVMVNGRWLPESEIQQRLEEIAAAYSEQ